VFLLTSGRNETQSDLSNRQDVAIPLSRISTKAHPNPYLWAYKKWAATEFYYRQCYGV